MTTKKTKQRNKEYINQNPAEAFQDIGKGVMKSVTTDLLKDSVGGLWDQLLGGGEYSGKKQHASGDLAAGEELDLQNLGKKTEKATADVEAGIDYRRDILRGSERSTHIANKETEMQINEILVAIKQLAMSTKELEIQFREVVVEQRIEKPSKYHLSFFEWVLTVLRVAKMRVEESSNWLSVFSNKKKRQQYWGMFKKHGTTFGLSNERVVATQTG